MAHRQNKRTNKTFQQRQTERRLRDERQRFVVDDIASRFSCSHRAAHDFADQCETRIAELDFDLAYSRLALDVWADPPEPVRPLIDALRELEAERRRHIAALGQVRERLLELTESQAAHQHLPLPIERYQEQLRDRLFPDLKPQPVPAPAVEVSADRGEPEVRPL